MAEVHTTKTVCDICGEDTNGFYYYETHTNVFGVIKELSLWIDTCESCTMVFRYDIPEDLMKERYDTLSPSKGTIEGIIEDLKFEVGRYYSKQL